MPFLWLDFLPSSSVLCNLTALVKKKKKLLFLSSTEWRTAAGTLLKYLLELQVVLGENEKCDLDDEEEAIFSCSVIHKGSSQWVARHV